MIDKVRLTVIAKDRVNDRVVVQGFRSNNYSIDPKKQGDLFGDQRCLNGYLEFSDYLGYEEAFEIDLSKNKLG